LNILLANHKYDDWIILVFHEVKNDKNPLSISPKDFTFLVNTIINNKEIEVLTISEARKKLFKH